MAERAWLAKAQQPGDLRNLQIWFFKMARQIAPQFVSISPKLNASAAKRRANVLSLSPSCLAMTFACASA
jgi:hypothetical protein